HSPFPQEAIGKVAEAAELLMALLGKHADIRHARPNVAQALTALDEIEACIVATTALPLRESEVTARIHRGLSSVGIPLDLPVAGMKPGKQSPCGYCPPKHPHRRMVRSRPRAGVSILSNPATLKTRIRRWRN